MKLGDPIDHGWYRAPSRHFWWFAPAASVVAVLVFVFVLAAALTVGAR